MWHPNLAGVTGLNALSTDWSPLLNSHGPRVLRAVRQRCAGRKQSWCANINAAFLLKLWVGYKNWVLILGAGRALGLCFYGRPVALLIRAHVEALCAGLRCALPRAPITRLHYKASAARPDAQRRSAKSASEQACTLQVARIGLRAPPGAPQPHGPSELHTDSSELRQASGGARVT